jgi:acyl-CoA thioesterase
MVKILKQNDADVERIADALRAFEKSHIRAECTVYRYNPASIRIKIVDSVFNGRDKGSRHDYAMKHLGKLPDDVLSQISILLCLIPGESSLMSLEFSDPSTSRL